MFTQNIPIINDASTRFITLESSFSLFALFLMIAKTDILLTAKEIPIKENQILKNQNSCTKGRITQQIKTKIKEISMDFLVPILLIKLTATKAL